MQTLLEKVTDDAMKLSVQERARLARQLLLSLDPEDEAEVEAAWEAEIEHRVQEIKAGRAQGRPAEQVFADIRARYRR
jgi:putative addiction module component (TIGR02574 family)